jgi:hypothetical protein
MQFHPYGLSKSKKLGVGIVCVSNRMRKSLESAEHRTSTEHVPCQEIDTNCCLAVSSYKYGDCAKIWGHICALSVVRFLWIMMMIVKFIKYLQFKAVRQL